MKRSQNLLLKSNGVKKTNRLRGFGYKDPYQEILNK